MKPHINGHQVSDTSEVHLVRRDLDDMVTAVMDSKRMNDEDKASILGLIRVIQINVAKISHEKFHVFLANFNEFKKCFADILSEAEEIMVNDLLLGLDVLRVSSAGGNNSRVSDSTHRILYKVHPEMV